MSSTGYFLNGLDDRDVDSDRDVRGGRGRGRWHDAMLVRESLRYRYRS